MDSFEIILIVVLFIIICLIAVVILYFLFKTQSRLDQLSKLIPDENSYGILSNRLKEIDDSSRKSFERLAGNLGEMSKATQQMMEVGKTISSLEDLLKPPKLRGGMGETLLAELLAQILPSNYQLQYQFRSGNRVDAIIELGDSIVPVDAKFPLEAFRRMIKTEDENEAKRERKLFIKAVKKHIDDIADKYILPDEGTYDFALMYIPAENVYYETIIKDEGDAGLFPYASERRVIPVSPNSFFAYLQVILRGLKGLRIEERALEIMNRLTRLQDDETRFRNEFDVLGKHLTNARNKYDETTRLLDRFEDKLVEIEKSEKIIKLSDET